MSEIITPIMALHDQKALSGMDRDEDSTDFSFSLNVGNELDEEKDEGIFIEPFEILSVLDITDEGDLVASLEARIDDLFYLADDIQKAIGMNQSFALEAEKLLPGFGGVPIGYYTKDTTATRYKVSLEEITKGIWALIAGVIVAIIGVIIKIFSFFSGKKEGGTSKDAQDNIDNAIKDVDETTSSINSANELMHEADSLLSNAKLTLLDGDGNAFQCTSLQLAVDKLLTNEERYRRAKEFLDFKNPIHYDLITFGTYTKDAILLGERLRSINDIFKIKVDAINDAIRSNIGSSLVAEDFQNLRKLNKVNTPIEFSIYGRTMSLREATVHLRDVRNALMDKEVSKDVNFDTLFSSILHVYSGSKIKHILTEVKNSLSTLADIQKHLDNMEGILRNLSTDGTPGAVTVDIGRLIQDTVKTLSSDLISFKELYAEISRFADDLKDLSNRAIGISIEVISKITSEMHKNDQTVPEGWQKVADDLKEYRKIIKFSFLKR